MARKVLLADDSVTAQNMGRKILTDAGYEVVTVNNGSAALKKIGETHPDMIVLDVYMPGYSGLEVCQRIKDSRDSAHIPVLLTVGKLEPFKQDEARKVRADAFIIKPFEASELMAALSKLESRLSTAPGPRKEGRHSPPATMESFERAAEGAVPQFGDQESGWKARIKFPSPASKSEQSEPEPEITPSESANFRDFAQQGPAVAPAVSGAPVMMDRPVPAGIPQDITPDEIAAITAAAARVQAGLVASKNVEPAVESQAPSLEQSSAPPAEVPVKEVKGTAESRTETIPREPEKPQSVAEAAAPAQSLASAATITHLPSNAPMEVAADEKASAQTKSAALIADANVEPESAAFETTGTTFAVVPSSEEETEEREPVAVVALEVSSSSAATPLATPASSKARWVAEEVPLEAQEAVLVLEREMHKAYAAFAAAEHAETYESAPIDRDDEPMFATMGPPPIGNPLPMMKAVSSTAELGKDGETVQEVRSAQSAMETAFHEIARSSEVSKPPNPPFAPAGPSLDEAKHSVAAFGGPQPFGVAEAVPDSARAEHKTEVPVPAAKVADEPETGQVADAAERKLDHGRDADLAAATRAAWANWREVRDSVLGAKGGSTPASSHNSEADLDELAKLKGLKKDEPASAGAPAALAAAASAEGTASSSDPNLSSIVDTMLAELKPKLMAELAEKLKQEKNKK